MGASGKWVKTLIGFKKQLNKENPEKTGEKKGKKWKLWKSSSGDHTINWKSVNKVVILDGSSSGCRNDEFNAAMATVVRAHPKDFRVVREEWGAIRIQTSFRGFLARRAFKALKGIVRLQALVRGRQVRKQAAVTLRCMQALVRVQARVRARQVRMSIEGQAVQHLLNERRIKDDPLKQAEEGWCDSLKTLDEVKTKLQMRQEGAFKRERAFAYSLAQQHLRSTLNLDAKTNISTSTLKSFQIDINSWSWLERWMDAKPWENRLMEEANTPILDVKNSLPKNLKDISPISFQLQTSVKVRKNNISTRISAKPPIMGQATTFSSSSLTIPISGMEESKPSYMNLTESTKAKRSNRVQRQSMDELQFGKKLVGFEPSLSSFSRLINLPNSKTLCCTGMGMVI